MKPFRPTPIAHDLQQSPKQRAQALKKASQKVAARANKPTA